ncbi:hypothetical protein [Magnetovibrio sp.]|uniref:hypothetical protein n=1 Tax=Magnetovibrio sp. TaxID=2024836 RepID=UPI002F92440E
MNTVTKTVHLDADRDRVFAFVSNIENLPKWAHNFCRDVKREGDDYKVVGSEGEIYFTIDADARTGVVDMSGGPSKDQMGCWPARVVGLPDGTSLFAFTCVQFPGVTDESFAADEDNVEAELESLRTLFV